MDSDIEVGARIPADIEAPDRIFYQLTARQVAILATAAAPSYLIFTTLTQVLPLPLVVLAIVPIIGVAAAVALSRRDGLPMDRWLWAAILDRRTPRRATPTPEAPARTPEWTPPTTGPVEAPPSVLRLPAAAIAANGVIDLGGGGSAVLVAATTVNIGLRTGAEQAAVVGGYARWLNSLTGPVQIVVSAQRVDLTSYAQAVADAADTLPHPALTDAALDHAEFLADLSEQRDPLWRTVTIVCTTTGERGAPAEALRRAEHTAAALAAIGSQTRVLDGETAAAVLTAATDPYQATDASWPRALPQHPITAAPVGPDGAGT